MSSPYDVILEPVISEKSMDMAQDKKYTFKVAVDANKTKIKQAIEEIFEVDVKKVNVINMEGKVKRLGRTQGKRSDYKKAIVTLSQDSKEIEFFQDL